MEFLSHIMGSNKRTHKITLELTDEDFETLESYVKKYHKGITIEEYLIIQFHSLLWSLMVEWSAPHPPVYNICIRSNSFLQKTGGN